LLEVVAEVAPVTEVDIQTTMHGLVEVVVADLYTIHHIQLLQEQHIQL
jgi:hypothetical protein